ncbi:MAG: deacylase [Pirellulaceae bacterium]|nr:MAG: deacylase [Pirellulaceae bacterium]
MMDLSKFLKQKHVPFEKLAHRETFDAQHLAHELHISGHRIAKTVVLKTPEDGAYYVAVLPAAERICFELASSLLNGKKVALASEQEIAERFADCELGAVPPFGSLYGMKTLLERSLLEQPWIVFEGQTHHEAIRMRVDDFVRIESPVVGDIAIEPLPSQ